MTMFTAFTSQKSITKTMVIRLGNQYIYIHLNRSLKTMESLHLEVTMNLARDRDAGPRRHMNFTSSLFSSWSSKFRIEVTVLVAYLDLGLDFENMRLKNLPTLFF
jgi:hypothetical protein